MLYTVKPMQVEDIPQVTEIDREAFPTQWPPISFQRELKNRFTRHLVAVERREPGKEKEEYTPSGAGNRAEGRLHGIVSRVRQFLGREYPPTGGVAMPANQNIVGYASLWLMLEEAHLTSIAVRQAYQGRGIGELLLIEAIDLAVELKAEVVTLEVRLSNLTAQLLYEKYSFNKVGIRRGYYTDNLEDAVIMTTDRITSAFYQANFQRLKNACVQKLASQE